MSVDDALAALPFIVLAGGAVLVGALARWLRADERSWMLLAVVVAFASGVGAALIGGGADGLGGLLRRDGLSVFVVVLAAASAAATALLETAHRAHDARGGARAAALILLCASGVSLMASAGDLAVAAIGLALLSVALAVLARPRHESVRGSLPYAALRRSAIAPLLFAIGSALILADTGSTRIGALASTNTVGQVGIALLLAALAQTMALVPFHVLAPDIDAGAAAPVAGYVAIVGRLGAFALLLRVAAAVTASGNAEADWRASLAVLAAVTMTVGSLVALAAPSARRALVFMAVAQAGVIAIGLASGGAAAPASAFALAVLVVLVGGAFAALQGLAGGDARVEDLRGLARRRPLLVGAFGVLTLGLAGLPPTAGFLAKVYLFEAATDARLAWLVVLGALSMAISAVCAFRVLLACLGESVATVPGRTGVATAVAVAAAALVLLLGLAPGPLRDAVQGVRF